MINKRGQLTIFIIVSILIVAIVILVLIFKDEIFKKENNQIEIDSLNNNILFCLEETTKEGIKYISLQGGYYNVTEDIILEYFTQKVPYYYNNSKINVPSKVRVENELGNYISDNLYKCTDLESYRKMGYNVTEGNISSEITITEEEVSVKISYPIKIENQEDLAELKEFETKVSSQINLLLTASKEIVTSYYKKPGYVCLTCLEEISSKNNVEISATPVETNNGKKVIWFSIYEKEYSSLNKLKWIFVVEQ